MAVVIAAGFAFIGYEVYKRSTDPDHPRTFSERFGTKPKAEPAAASAAPAAVRPMASVPSTPAPLPASPVTLPPGAVLLPGLAAVDGRIAVQIRLADGRTQVLLVDPGTGDNAVVVTTVP